MPDKRLNDVQPTVLASKPLNEKDGQTMSPAATKSRLEETL